ncbi:BUR1 [Candida theae]|uniref:Serine/threonine-protein kinase BUR1 n=1 Tax=Candida theae TaxID=1198502 RepID=A0AAD5BGJ2_9ASCO|nr:BUR1 [Candida theae]KAI5959525.1 BUR1 [Candida theae]
MSFIQNYHRQASETHEQSGAVTEERESGDLSADPIPEMSKLDQYEMIQKLGQGTFGVVQKARNKRTGEIVAIKQLLNHSAKEGFPITAMREITILKQLDHHNILNIVDIIFGEPEVTNPADVVTQRGSFYTVAPYMTSDLVGILENPEVSLALSEIKCIMMQLLQGLQYIHEQNYLHRDIKAANILIDSKGILKIADFGLARFYHGDVPRLGMGPGGGEKDYTALVVTRWYRPPELLLGERKYTTAVDLWGVGCVFAELFTRKPILVGKSDVHQAQLIFELIGSPENWEQAAKLPNKSHFNVGLGCKRSLERRFESMMPHSAVQLLSGLLTLDPYKRVNSLDALNHEFFKCDPLPSRPEEMPQFGECHEIDKERFKKLKESNHMVSKQEPKVHLKDTRFDRDEYIPANARVAQRGGYDDYGETYARRTHSRQAHESNEYPVDEKRHIQRRYPVRSYNDDRDSRTQDAWRKDEYDVYDYENERPHHKSLDYRISRGFENQQVYSYVPRSELNDAQHSKWNSPRPLSRGENRSYGHSVNQNNIGGVNYSESRSMSRLHGAPRDALLKERSREPERDSFTQENWKSIEVDKLKGDLKMGDIDATVDSSLQVSSDVSMAIGFKKNGSDDGVKEKEGEKGNEKDVEEKEIDKDKEKDAEKKEIDKDKGVYKEKEVEKEQVVDDVPASRESWSRCDHISHERGRISETIETRTSPQKFVDYGNTKCQRDFVSSCSSTADREPSNDRRQDDATNVSGKVAENTTRDMNIKETAGDQLQGKSAIKDLCVQESKPVSEKNPSSDNVFEESETNADKTFINKATKDQKTQESHGSSFEPQILETTKEKVGSAVDLNKNPRREDFNIKSQTRVLPYVHGGLSERVTSFRSSSNPPASPFLKDLKTNKGITNASNLNAEKIDTPELVVASPSKGVEPGKTKLFATTTSEASRSSRLGGSREPIKTDLFGKTKTNSLPINPPRLSVARNSARAANGNSTKRGLVSNVLRAVLRETLESAIIISVLLSFVHQTFYNDDGKRSNSHQGQYQAIPSDSSLSSEEVQHFEAKSVDKKLGRALKLQIWLGGLLGLAVCLCIGGCILVVFYKLGSDLWSIAEHYWEGTFSILASVIISVMGIQILRVNKMQEKWKVKLGRLLQSSVHFNQSIVPSPRNPETSWLVQLELLTEKYNMVILPFVTTLREGLEAIVFIGGIGVNKDTSIWAIINAAVIALAVGTCVGCVLYKSGNSLSLQWFLISSTCFLYLVAAGLFSKGVWSFELQQFINQCGGMDVSETGHGPGSYDITKSVWHVNCCNGEMQEDGAFWMLLTAIIGWTNSATPITVATQSHKEEEAVAYIAKQPTGIWS